MGFESIKMDFCAIAFVGDKTILRILTVERVHLSVAIDFGNDGGGSNAETFRVAFDDKLHFPW